MSARAAARERAGKRLIFALDVGWLREAGEYVRAFADKEQFRAGQNVPNEWWLTLGISY